MGDREEKVKLGRLKLKLYQNKKKKNGEKEKEAQNELPLSPNPDIPLPPLSPNHDIPLPPSLNEEDTKQNDSPSPTSSSPGFDESLPSSIGSSLEQWAELITDVDQENTDKKPTVWPIIDALKNKIKEYEIALIQRDDLIDKMRVRIIELHKEQEDSRSDSHKIEQDIMSVIKPQLQQLIVGQQNKPQVKNNDEEECNHCIHYKQLEEELGLVFSKNCLLSKENYEFSDTISLSKHTIANFNKEINELSETAVTLLNAKIELEDKLNNTQEVHKKEKEAFEHEIAKLTVQLEDYSEELNKINNSEEQLVPTRDTEGKTKVILNTNKQLLMHNQQLETNNYKLQKLQDEFALKIYDLEIENSNLLRCKKDLEQQLEQADKELQDHSLLLSEKELLQRRLNEMELQLEETKLNYKINQDELFCLRDQLHRNIEDNNQESLSHKEFQNHLADLKVESQEHSFAYSLLSSDKNKLEQRLVSVEQELEDIQLKYELKLEELTNVNDQLNRNNEIIDQDKLEIDSLKRQLHEISREEVSLVNDMLLNYKKELELQINLFDKEYKDISSEFEMTQNKLIERMNKTDAELLLSNKKLEDSENELHGIVKECQSKQAEIININKQLIGYKQQLEQVNCALTEKLTESTIKNNNLNEDNLKLVRYKTDLEQSLHRINTEHSSSYNELLNKKNYVEQQLEEIQSNYTISQEELVQANSGLLEIKNLVSYIEKIEKELSESSLAFESKEKELATENMKLHDFNIDIELKLQQANKLLTDVNMNNNETENENKLIIYHVYLINSLVEDLKLFLTSQKTEINICGIDKIAKDFHHGQIASIYLNNFSNIDKVENKDANIESSTIQVVNFIVEKCQEMLKSNAINEKRDESSTLIESMDLDSLLSVSVCNQSLIQENNNQDLESTQASISKKSWLDKSEIADDSCNLEPAQTQFLLSELVETFVQINQEVIRHLNHRGSEKQNAQLLPHCDDESLMQSFNASWEAPENYSLEYTEDGLDLTPNTWLSLQPIMEEDVVLGITKTLKANFSVLSHKLDTSRSDDYKIYMRQLETQSEEHKKEMATKNQSIDGLQCLIKQLENDSKKLEEKTSHLSHDLQLIRTEKNNLEGEKQILIEKLHFIQNQNQMLTANSSDAMQELLKENTDLRNEKNNREHHYKKEIQQLQTKIQQLELDILAIVKEKERLLELKREEIEDLNNKVEAQDKQIKCANKFINDQTLERELEREDHNKLKDEYEKLSKEKEKFLGQSTDYQKELKNLEFKLMAKVKKVKRITLENEGVNKELAQQKDRIKDLEDIIQNLDLDLQKKSKKLDSVEKEKSEYCQILERLDSIAKQEPCSIDNVIATNMNSDLIEQIELLKDQVKNLKEESHLKNTYEAIINEFDTQLHALEQRVDAHCRAQSFGNPDYATDELKLPQEDNRTLSPVSQYSENIHRINVKLEKIFKMHSSSFNECQKLINDNQAHESEKQLLINQNLLFMQDINLEENQMYASFLKKWKQSLIKNNLNSCCLAHLQKETETLCQQLKIQGESIHQITDENKKLHSDLMQNLTQLNALQKENQALDTMMQDESKHIISLEKEIANEKALEQQTLAQLQNKLDVLSKESQSYLDNISELQKQLKEHNQDNKFQSENLQQLTSEKEHLYKELSQQEELVKEYKIALQQVSQKNSELNIKLDQTTIENSSNLSQFQNELKILKEELSFLSENLQQTTEEKCQLHQTLLEQTQILKNLEEFNAALEKKCNEYDEATKLLSIELKAIKEEKDANIISQIESLKAEIKSLKELSYYSKTKENEDIKVSHNASQTLQESEDFNDLELPQKETPSVSLPTDLITALASLTQECQEFRKTNEKLKQDYTKETQLLVEQNFSLEQQTASFKTQLKRKNSEIELEKQKANNLLIKLEGVSNVNNLNCIRLVELQNELKCLNQERTPKKETLCQATKETFKLQQELPEHMNKGKEIHEYNLDLHQEKLNSVEITEADYNVPNSIEKENYLTCISDSNESHTKNNDVIIEVDKCLDESFYSNNGYECLRDNFISLLNEIENHIDAHTATKLLLSYSSMNQLQWPKRDSNARPEENAWRINKKLENIFEMHLSCIQECNSLKKSNEDIKKALVNINSQLESLHCTSDATATLKGEINGTDHDQLNNISQKELEVIIKQLETQIGFYSQNITSSISEKSKFQQEISNLENKLILKQNILQALFAKLQIQSNQLSSLGMEKSNYCVDIENLCTNLKKEEENGKDFDYIKLIEEVENLNKDLRENLSSSQFSEASNKVMPQLGRSTISSLASYEGTETLVNVEFSNNTSQTDDASENIFKSHLYIELDKEPTELKKEHELEIQLLQTQVLQYLEEINALKAQMELEKITNSDLQNKLEVISKENKYNLTNVSELQKELIMLNQQLSIQAKSLEKIVEGKQVLLEQLSKQQMMLNEVQQSNQAQELQLNSTDLASLEKSLTKQMHSEQQNDVQIQNKLKEVLDENNLHSGLLSELQLQLGNLKQQLSLQEEMLCLISKENNQLKQELTEQVELIKESQECNNTLKAQLSNLDLKQESEVEERQKAKLQTQFEAQTYSPSEKFQQSTDDQKELQQNLIELQGEVKHLKATIESLNLDYQLKLDKLISKKEQLIEENKLEKLLNSQLTDKLELIVNENNWNTNNLVELQSELDEVNQQLHIQNERLEQVTRVKCKLEQDANQHTEVLKRLEECNQAQTTELEISCSKLIDLQECHQEFRKHNENLNKEKALLNEETAALKSQLKELSASSASLITLKDLENKQTQELQKYIQLQEEFEAMSKENVCNITIMDNLERELERQSQHHYDYVQEISENIDALRHELSQHQSWLKDMQEIKQSLETKLELNSSQFEKLIERINFDLNSIKRENILTVDKQAFVNTIESKRDTGDSVETLYDAVVKEFVSKLKTVDETIDKHSGDLKTFNDNQLEESLIENGSKSPALQYYAAIYRINSKLEKIFYILETSESECQDLQLARETENLLMEHLQEENSNLQLKIEDYQLLNEDNYLMIENFKKENELLEKLNSQYTSEIKELKSNLQEFEKSSQETLEKLTQQQNYEQQKKGQLILKLELVSKELDVKSQQFAMLEEEEDTQNKQLRQCNAQLLLQLEEATKTINTKTMHLKEHQNELTKLKQLQTESLQYSNSEINCLQQELALCKNKLKEFEDSHMLELDHQNRIQQLLANEKNLVLKLKLAEENISSKIKSLEFVSEEKEKYELFSDQLQKEVETLEDKLKVQVGEIQRIVKENEQLEKELSENSTENQKLRDTILKLQNEFRANSEAEVEDHSPCMNNAMWDELKEENSTLFQKLEKAQTEIEDLEIKLQFLTEEKTEIVTENENFQHEIAQLRNLIGDLEKVVEAQEGQLELKTQSLLLLEESAKEPMPLNANANLLSELNDATNENDQLFNYLEDLQRKSAELRQLVNSKQLEIELMSKEYKLLAQELASYKTKVKELQMMESNSKHKSSNLYLEKASLENKVLLLINELEKVTKASEEHHLLANEYKHHLENISEQHANTQQAYRTQVLELENKEKSLKNELKQLGQIQQSEKNNLLFEMSKLKSKLNNQRIEMEKKLCDYKISKDNDTQKQIEELKNTFRRPIGINNTSEVVSSKKLEKKAMRRTLKNLLVELIPNGYSNEFEELLDTAVQIEKEPPESTTKYSKEALFSLFKSCTDKLISHYLVKLNISNQTNLSLLTENQLLSLQTKYNQALTDIEEEQALKLKLQHQKLEQQEKRFKMELASKEEEIEMLLTTITHNSSRDSSYEVLVNKLPDNVKSGIRSVDSMGHEDLNSLRAAYSELKLEFTKLKDNLSRKDVIIINLRFDLDEKTAELTSLEDEFKLHQTRCLQLSGSPSLLSDKTTSSLKSKTGSMKDESFARLEREFKNERRQKSIILKRLKEAEYKVEFLIELEHDVLLLRKENGTLVGRVKELEIEIGLWKESHRFKPEIYNQVAIKKLQYRCCRQSHDRKALIVQKKYLEKVLLSHKTPEQSLLDLMSGRRSRFQPKLKGKQLFRSVVAVVISTYRLKKLVQLHKLNGLQENGLL